MFSVSISGVLLVFFVSQALGQNNTTTTSVYASSTSASGLSDSVLAASFTNQLTPTTLYTTSYIVPTTNIVSTTKTSVQPGSTEVPTTPSAKTCAILGVVLDKPWQKDHGDQLSDTYRNESHALSSALKNLYNNIEKYQEVEVSNVNFTNKTDKPSAKARLCLVFKGGDKDLMEDVFKSKVESGKLGDGVPVVKDSAELEPVEVEFEDWEAEKGECEDKCEGAGGPFKIVRKCKANEGFSCNGLKKKTGETDDCTKYCPSRAVAVAVSSLILAIGIFLSSSFQWC